MSEFDCSNNATYIPGGGVTPTGTIEITDNGTYNVAQYANADVNVSGGGTPQLLIDMFERDFVDVIVPNGVQTIGQRAFYYATTLRSIQLSDTVESIEEYAFQSSSLTSISFPNNPTTFSIAESAFRGCTSLTEITFPNNIASIPERVCQASTALASVDIPSSVTSIGTFAFYGCSNLRSITVRATECPTLLSGDPFGNIASDYVIYVPQGSVSAYKSQWSAYASHIQAIQE